MEIVILSISLWRTKLGINLPGKLTLCSFVDEVPPCSLRSKRWSAALQSTQTAGTLGVPVEVPLGCVGWWMILSHCSGELLLAHVSI